MCRRAEEQQEQAAPAPSACSLAAPAPAEASKSISYSSRRKQVTEHPMRFPSQGQPSCTAQPINHFWCRRNTTEACVCPQAIAERQLASTNHRRPAELHVSLVAKLSRRPHSPEPMQLGQLCSEDVMRGFC